MDSHVYDHLDPDSDPQKICGSRSGSRVTKLHIGGRDGGFGRGEWRGPYRDGGRERGYM